MKYPHILFLDLDGPLYSQRALLLSENNEFAKPNLKELNLNSHVTYWYADPVAIMMLVELYRLRSYQIVLTGAWADIHNKEQIEELLKRNYFAVPLHKNWKIESSKYEDKPKNIRTWLNNNPHSDYLVLDDTNSGEVFKNQPLLKEHNLDKDKILLVEESDGILMSDFYKLQAIVLNWD